MYLHTLFIKFNKLFLFLINFILFVLILNDKFSIGVNIFKIIFELCMVLHNLHNVQFCTIFKIMIKFLLEKKILPFFLQKIVQMKKKCTICKNSIIFRFFISNYINFYNNLIKLYLINNFLKISSIIRFFKQKINISMISIIN